MPDTPASGWFTTQVAVTVASTDADVASVEYRTSNSDSWKTYTGPITLGDGAWNVQARATDQAGNVSDVVERAIRIDTLAPVVHASVSENRVLTVTGSDANLAVLQYAVDGGAWANYGGPVQLSKDARVVQYRAADAAGNSSSGQIDVSAKPVATITSTTLSGPARVNVGKPFTLTARVAPATVAGSIQFRAGSQVLGTVSLKAGSASLSVTGATLGKHAYQAAFVPADTRAATASTSQPTSVTVTKWSASVKVRTSPVPVGKPSVIRVHVTSHDGPTPTGRVRIKIGARSRLARLSHGTASVRIAGLSRGSHRVVVSYAGDKANESASGSATVVVTKAKGGHAHGHR